MRRDRVSSILCAVCVCLLFGFPGCGERRAGYRFVEPAGEEPRPGVPALPGPVVEAEGNFAYVQAAARWALAKCELTFLSVEEPADETLVYRLLTVRGEPGYLIVQRTDAGASAQAQIGHFGAPDAERELLETLAKRFHALRTGKAAP